VGSAANDLNELSREELIALIRRQAELIEKLQRQVEDLQRKRHRQAAPFSRNERKPTPRRNGRRPGEGRFENRPAPPASSSDIQVTVTKPELCPKCGGAVELERVEEATVTDVVPEPRPRVVRYEVPVCRCVECGTKVRGKAAGLAGNQTGATAHRLGPRSKALAHLLHYGLGIPVRKLPQILWETTGLRVTASALTQDALKQAKGEGAIGRQYQALRDAMRQCSVVHTDDTGWRIGGTNAHLMGFGAMDKAVYQIRYQHRSEEVAEIIPANFAGVLVSDRGKSYDAEMFAAMKQQKCLAHLLRNISEVLETKVGRARVFGCQLQVLLRQALAFKRQSDSPLRTEAIDELDRKLTWLLRNRTLKDDDNQRLLNGIGTQMDRGRILTFLRIAGVDPTNNAAERLLRPAVIARKVSQCSKNDSGAHATSAFLSVIQTLRKQLPPSSPVTEPLLGLMAGNSR
jgi:transposase